MKKFNKSVKTAIELAIIALVCVGSYEIYQYFFYINTTFAEAHGASQHDILGRVDMLNMWATMYGAFMVFIFTGWLFKDTRMFSL